MLPYVAMYTQQHCAKKTQLVPEMCPGQKVCRIEGTAWQVDTFKVVQKKLMTSLSMTFFPWKQEKKWSDFTQDGFL